MLIKLIFSRLLALLIFTVVLATTTSTAEYCYDVDGNRFPEGAFYFRDQDIQCVIMLCAPGGIPTLRYKLCDTPAVCQSPLECPHVLMGNYTYDRCTLPDGEVGVYCPPDRDREFYPKVEYDNLSAELVRAVAASGLSQASIGYLLSAPPVSADGRSAAEAFIRAALLNTSQEELDRIIRVARETQAGNEALEENLLLTKQLPEQNSSTSVFNFNFDTSDEAQTLGREALTQILVSSLILGLDISTPTTQLTTQTFPVYTRTTAPLTDTWIYTRETTPTPVTRDYAYELAKLQQEEEGPLCSCEVVDQGELQSREKCTCRKGGSGESFTVFKDGKDEDGKDLPARRSVAFPNFASPGCVFPLPFICDASAIYRTANGRCNNLNQPRWGSALTPVRRMFPNTYSDSIFAPTSGPSLPNPRLVSEMVMGSEPADLGHRTLTLMSWGQFLDHDIIHTPIFQLPKNQGIECCLPTSTLPPPFIPVHPQCFPIEIRAGDAFYDPHNQRCMNLVRSVPAPTCLGPVNQLNDITHWIDGSQIYGSSLETQKSLRTLTGGRLRTSSGNLLPLEKPIFTGGGTSGYGTSCQQKICFVAGDTRANENPVLAVYHTIFVREHNRIAGKLQAQGLTNDEEIFQKARRIVIAELQHIIYNEWLPALLGYSYTASVGLRPNFSGHSNVYIPFLNPNIANVFATAGFRLHSLVQGLIHFVSSSGASSSVPLRDTFFEPSALLNPGRFTQIARGITIVNPRRFDHRFTSDVRGQLFSTGCFGLDLVSLNIQRGRDHGIAKYVTVLQWCTGLTVNVWTDLLPVMTAENIERLKTVYILPEDIDLYAGLNLESVAPGAVVGHTSRCLITEQFLRLRYADRFFYDLGGQPGSFTTAQLNEVKKVYWAKIMCNNVGGDFTAVQKRAFFLSHPFFNPKLNCNALPDINFSLF